MTKRIEEEKEIKKKLYASKAIHYLIGEKNIHLSTHY